MTAEPVEEFAVEADPGRLTASFPIHDSYADALHAAHLPAFERPGLPAPRVLVRADGGPWCVALTVDADDLRSAYRTWSSRSDIAAAARAFATRAAARSDMSDEQIDAIRVECGLEPLFTKQEQGVLFATTRT